MTRIAIIGGGCAGLAAARTLLQARADTMKVVLIDAFDRLGGRAWTNDSENFPFDLGADVIQDAGINPWMKIAEQLKFETQAAAFDTVYRVCQQNVWQDMSSPPETISAVAGSLAKSYDAAHAFANAPVTGAVAGDDADTLIALGSDDLGCVAESVEPWQYIAADRARQVEVDGNDAGIVFVKSGLGTLVAALGKWLQDTYRETLETRRGTVVTCIRRKCAAGTFEILAGDQLLCEAEYCIVSVPCSALTGIAFIPPLDRRHIVANGYVALGSCKKVAFRPRRMPEAIAENVEYFMPDVDNRGCWQYFRLPTRPDALVGVASGTFAARLDRKPAADAAAAFISALNKAYPSLPEKIASAHTPLVTNWSSQPHIWGASSYTRYDGGDRDDPTAFDARVEIAKPHAEGRIHFAGEATSTEAYGTIHGAYASGERAARDILTALGLP